MRVARAARHAGVAGLLLCAGAALHAQDITSPRLAAPGAVSRELTRRYPAHYERAGVGGLVRLRAFITAAGRADSVRVLSRSGVGLDGRAVSVLREARFMPADSAGVPVSAWAEFELRFGEPSQDTPPALLERDVVKTRAHAHYPAAHRGDGLRQTVVTYARIDETGRVVRAWQPLDVCFPAFGEAARALAEELRFEAEPGTPERLTAFTAIFSGDSVSLTFRGDSDPPPQPRPPRDAPEPARPASTQRPELRNTAVVQKALVDRVSYALQLGHVPGDVTVWLFVDERGRVTRRQVSESTGVCDFERSALEVALLMRFTPARRNGKAVGAWVELPIHFFQPQFPPPLGRP